MKNFRRILFLIYVLSFQTIAGVNGGGNGGDSIDNSQGGRSLLDLVEKDELTYFNFRAQSYLTDENSQDLERLAQGIDSMNPKGHKVFPINTHNKLESQLKKSFTEIRWAFTDIPLEEINDEGEIKTSSLDTKRQLAVQSGNLVVINRYEFDLIDRESKMALKLHEGLIHAVTKLNPFLIKQKGTAPIRRVVRNLFNYYKGTEIKYSLELALQELNIPKEVVYLVDLFKEERQPWSVQDMFLQPLKVYPYHDSSSSQTIIYEAKTRVNHLAHFSVNIYTGERTSPIICTRRYLFANLKNCGSKLISRLRRQIDSRNFRKAFVDNTNKLKKYSRENIERMQKNGEVIDW